MAVGVSNLPIISCWAVSTALFAVVVFGFCLSPRALGAGDAPSIMSARPTDPAAVVGLVVCLALLSAASSCWLRAWASILEDVRATSRTEDGSSQQSGADPSQPGLEAQVESAGQTKDINRVNWMPCQECIYESHLTVNGENLNSHCVVTLARSLLLCMWPLWWDTSYCCLPPHAGSDDRGRQMATVWAHKLWDDLSLPANSSRAGPSERVAGASRIDSRDSMRMPSEIASRTTPESATSKESTSKRMVSLAGYRQVLPSEESVDETMLEGEVAVGPCHVGALASTSGFRPLRVREEAGSQVGGQEYDNGGKGDTRLNASSEAMVAESPSAGRSSGWAYHAMVSTGTGTASDGARPFEANWSRDPKERLLEAIRFLGMIGIPVGTLVLFTILGMALDLFVGPGRGSNKVLSMWILWPALARLDYDRAAIPWVGLQLFYTIWTAVLHAVISSLGDSWPLGRGDIDLLPAATRYDFASPVGLNGLGITFFLVSLLILESMLIPIVMGIDSVYLRWRAEMAERELLLSTVAARRQQTAILRTVVSQVPSFAQECLDAGVTAFETKPVVLAARRASDGERTRASDRAHLRLPGTRPELDQDREDQAALCSLFDRYDFLGQNLKSRAAAMQSAGVLRRASKLFRSAMQSKGQGPGLKISITAMGLVSKTQRQSLAWLARFPFQHFASALAMDKIACHLPHNHWANASPPSGSSSGSVDTRTEPSRLATLVYPSVTSSSWVGAVGLRTPPKHCPVLNHSEQRAVTAFQCLCAIEHALSASIRSRDATGYTLVAGVSYPSSSQSSMSIGLLGEYQQPQEWHAFGGGMDEAKRLCGATLVGAGPQPDAMCHVVLGRRTCDRIDSTLKSMQAATEAAVQWHLAIVSHDVHEEEYETHRSSFVLDLKRLYRVLAACKMLRSMIEYGVQPSNRGVATKMYTQGSSSRTPAAVGAAAAAYCEHHQAKRESVDEPGEQRVMLCFADERKQQSSPTAEAPTTTAQRSTTAQECARSIRVLLFSLIDRDTLTSCKPSARTRSPSEWLPPRWAVQFLHGANRSSKDSAANRRNSGAASSFAPVANYGGVKSDVPRSAPSRFEPLSGIILPQAGETATQARAHTMTGRAWGFPVDYHATTGMALQSPAIILLFGVGYLIDCILGAVIMNRIERAADEQAGVAPDSPSVGWLPIFLIYLPMLLISTTMVARGAYAHIYFGRISETEGVTYLAGTALAQAANKLLTRLDIVVATCTAQNNELLNNTSVIATMLLAVGIIKSCGTSMWTFLAVFGLGMSSGNGLYLAIRSWILGPAAAPDRCNEFLGDAAESNADVLRILTTLISSVYVVQFALTHFIDSSESLALLTRVRHAAKSTRKSQEYQRYVMEQAATTLMPRQVLAKLTATSGSRSSHVASPQYTLPIAGQPASLGYGAVLTLRLGRFAPISDLAGPLATLALFRRIGRSIDQVCAQFGALRVSVGPDTIQLGWFDSQSEVQTDSVLSTGSNASTMAVLGACQLAASVRHTLEYMRVGIVPSIGIATGEVCAWLVGHDPVTVEYGDSGQGAGGAIASSMSISGSAQATHADATGVSLSPAVAVAVREYHPWIACMLHREDSADSKAVGLEWEGVLQCSQSLPLIPAVTAGLHRAGTSYAVCMVEETTPGTWRVCEVPAPGGDQQQHFEPPAWARAWQDALSVALGDGAGSGAHTEVAAWLRYVGEANHGSLARVGASTPGSLATPVHRIFIQVSSVPAVDMSACAAGAYFGDSQGAHPNSVALNTTSPTAYYVVGRAIHDEEHSSAGHSPSAVLESRSWMSFDDFKLLKLLGEGGFAKVYAAQHRATGKHVALKISVRSGSPGELSDRSFSAGHTARRASLRADVIRNEVVTLARAAAEDIPGPCRIFGVVVDEPRVAIVLERVTGSNLRDLVRGYPGRWRVDESDVRSIARSLARTIAKLHHAGVLHRDLKPSNVLMSSAQDARLIDFGLAVYIPAINSASAARRDNSVTSTDSGSEAVSRGRLEAYSRYGGNSRNSSAEHVSSRSPRSSGKSKGGLALRDYSLDPKAAKAIWVPQDLLNHDEVRLALPLLLPTADAEIYSGLAAGCSGRTLKVDSLATSTTTFDRTRAQVHSPKCATAVLLIAGTSDVASPDAASPLRLANLLESASSGLLAVTAVSSVLQGRSLLREEPSLFDAVVFLTGTDDSSAGELAELEDAGTAFDVHREGDKLGPAAIHVQDASHQYRSFTLHLLTGDTATGDEDLEGIAAAASSRLLGFLFPEPVRASAAGGKAPTRPAGAHTGAACSPLQWPEASSAAPAPDRTLGRTSSLKSNQQDSSRASPHGDVIHREYRPFAAGIAGTPMYMAPELFMHQGQKASDYFSLGVTLFWLVSGKLPFNGLTANQQAAAARVGQISWRMLPRDISPQCVDLLRGLLEPNASLRYDAGILAAHPFLLPDNSAAAAVRQEVLRIGMSLPVSRLPGATGDPEIERQLQRMIEYRWNIDRASDGTGSSASTTATSALVLDSIPPTHSLIGASQCMDGTTAATRRLLHPQVEGQRASLSAPSAKQARKNRSREAREAEERAILEVYSRRLRVRVLWPNLHYCRRANVGQHAAEQAAYRDFKALGVRRSEARVKLLDKEEEMLSRLRGQGAGRSGHGADSSALPANVAEVSEHEAAATAAGSAGGARDPSARCVVTIAYAAGAHKPAEQHALGHFAVASLPSVLENTESGGIGTSEISRSGHSSSSDSAT